MSVREARLALGPIPFAWPRQRVLDFYEDAARWPVDTVCLGETACAKRSALSTRDWLGIGRRLEAAGREVVFTSPPGLETPGEIGLVERLADGGRFAIEVNDVGLFHRLGGRAPLVAGPHLQVYSAATLRTLIRWGAFRWVAPYEIDANALAGLTAGLPDCLDTEVLVLGFAALAHSPWCMTAARLGLTRRDCAIACRDAPRGDVVRSLEDEVLFRVDGRQALSGLPVNLIGEIEAVRAAGATVLRFQPTTPGMGIVLRAVRRLLDRRMTAPMARRVAEAALGQPGTNGFWHGCAGREQVEVPLWPRRRCEGPREFPPAESRRPDSRNRE